jgi:hypothetical protein
MCMYAGHTTQWKHPVESMYIYGGICYLAGSPYTNQDQRRCYTIDGQAHRRGEPEPNPDTRMGSMQEDVTYVNRHRCKLSHMQVFAIK